VDGPAGARGGGKNSIRCGWGRLSGLCVAARGRWPGWVPRSTPKRMSDLAGRHLDGSCRSSHRPISIFSLEPCTRGSRKSGRAIRRRRRGPVGLPPPVIMGRVTSMPCGGHPPHQIRGLKGQGQARRWGFPIVLVPVDTTRFHERDRQGRRLEGGISCGPGDDRAPSIAPTSSGLAIPGLAEAAARVTPEGGIGEPSRKNR
jgi:hypothetical protein